VLILRFDQRLAAMSAEDFIAKILIAGLGVKHLVVGDDFRFGCGRQGDFAMLAAAGRKGAFRLEQAQTYEIDGRRVSSTLVREALARGDMHAAERLLGRPYSVPGRVVLGRQEGRRLGFPTINLRLSQRSPLPRGIYAVRVSGLDESRRERDGVAYISERPNGAAPCRLLEVHIFDYDGDCYGRRVRVDLRARLREDRQFDSEEDLRQQIGRDARQARELLAQH
jgi:riboflavin kinase/FMN adenylyltransferase